MGNYKREATLSEKHLFEGIKILDSKLGVCAHQVRIPSFMFVSNVPVDERGVSWLNYCDEMGIYESEIICASNSDLTFYKV